MADKDLGTITVNPNKKSMVKRAMDSFGNLVGDAAENVGSFIDVRPSITEPIQIDQPADSVKKRALQRKVTPKVKIVGGTQEIPTAERPDLPQEKPEFGFFDERGKSISDIYKGKTYDKNYQTQIDKLLSDPVKKEDEKKTAPLKGFPYDKPKKNLLERISGAGKTPIFLGKQEYDLATDPDKEAFKRKTAKQIRLENYRKLKEASKKRYSAVENVVEGANKFYFTDVNGFVHEYASDNIESARKKAIQIDNDMRRTGTLYYKDADGGAKKSYTGSLVDSNGDIGKIITASTEQLGKEYWTNYRLLEELKEEGADNFFTRMDTKVLAGLKTAGEALFTVGGPTVFLGFGQPVARGVDTITSLVGIDSPMMSVYADVATMNLEDEMVRMHLGGDDLFSVGTNIGYSSPEPFKIGVDPNIASITVDQIDSNTERKRNRRPDFIHTIVPRFLEDYALVVSALYPFKAGAKQYAERIRNDAIDSLGYKLSEDGKTFVLKKPIKKGEKSDVPSTLNKRDLYTEMRKLHLENIKNESTNLVGRAKYLAKSVFREQQFMYGTNPTQYLKSLKGQEFGATVLVEGLISLMRDNNTLYEQSKWYESGTNMFLEFLAAGVGSLGGGKLAQQNIPGLVIDGVKYVPYQLGRNIPGLGVLANIFSPSGLILEGDALVQFNKLDKKQRKLIRNLGRDINTIRDDNPEFKKLMDQSYDFYTQLRRELLEANKRTPQEYKFNEEDLTSSLGSIFQLRGLTIMRQQLLTEVGKDELSELNPINFIKAFDVVQKQEQKLLNVLEKQIQSLKVISADEANTSITKLKEYVETTYGNYKNSIEQTQSVIGKAVGLRISQIVDEIDLDENGAKVLSGLLDQHEFFNPNDGSVKAIENITDVVKNLRRTISLNYLGGVNNEREKLKPFTNPQSDKTKIIPYNVNIYDNKGKLKTEGKVTTILVENEGAAKAINDATQENGLGIINNIINHYKIQYSKFYDTVENKIPEEYQRSDIGELVKEINNEFKSGGQLVKSKEVQATLKDIVDDVLKIQLDERYKQVYNTLLDSDATNAETLGQFKKLIREDIVEDLNRKDKFGQINAIDEMEHLQKEYEGDFNFNIETSYKMISALNRSVNAALRNLKPGEGGKEKVLQNIKNKIKSKKDIIHKTIEENVDNGADLVRQLKELDPAYKRNVGDKVRQSKILQFITGNRGEYTGVKYVGDDQDEKLKDLAEGFENVDSKVNILLDTPKVKTTYVVNAEQKKLFDWIFENISASEMENELRTIFNDGKTVRKGNYEETVFDAVTESSTGYAGYKAFLDNYDKYVASKIAGMLDKAMLTGGTKTNNLILNTNVLDAEAWKKITDTVNYGDVPGLIGNKENLEFLQKVQAFESVTGGQMKIGRRRHYDHIVEWLNGNEELDEGWSEVMKLSKKVIDGRFANADRIKGLHNKVIRSVETRAKRFANLSNHDNFFQYAMENKKELLEAKEAAIKAGMNSGDWDNTVKKILIKALIERNTFAYKIGKVKYSSKSDGQVAKELAVQNNVPTDSIQKSIMKTKNGAQEDVMIHGTTRDLDGTGMLRDLEEYGETLAEFWGENDAVLEHFKLITKLTSFIAADEQAIKSLKQGKFKRGVKMSLPMAQSRLWAIASNRASYHYALSEALLAFANGRNLDLAYGLLNADADLSGAMAKMFATGETRFSAEISPKYIESFYGDVIAGLAELNQGYQEYLETQDPYRKMLAVLFEMNPDKSPEGLFPEKKINRNYKDDIKIQDNNLLYNRKAYLQEIGRRFVEKLKQGPEASKDLTMQDIFNEAFAEYQAQSKIFTP